MSQDPEEKEVSQEEKKAQDGRPGRVKSSSDQAEAKKAKSQDYVRPGRAWVYFREKGIRISGESKPKIVDMLNSAVVAEIDKIIEKLPKFSKGQSKGDLKRKTIKLDDL